MEREICVMILTEEEAQNKHCPYLDKKCIGSDCMAWKWHYKEYFKDEGFKPYYTKTNKGFCSKGK